jgi:hypothetical protein
MYDEKSGGKGGGVKQQHQYITIVPFSFFLYVARGGQWLHFNMTVSWG